jgi:hypothetical protein
LKNLIILLFVFLISNSSYSQFSIGLTGDSKTPIGFEVGIKRFNMVLMTSSTKSDGYTPIAYGNNSVNRRTVNSVVGLSGGIKIYKELYTDLGLLLSSTTDKVNVSNPSKGSYSYDPGDDYPTKSEVGMILGLSYYFEKIKVSSGFNLYESGAAFKYGISYRF